MDRSMWPSQHHHRRGHSLGSGVREKDEDLALFRNMGKRSDQPAFLDLGTGTNDQFIDATLLAKFGGLSHPQSAPPVQRNGIGAELLNSDVDKTDYDWLMTPPGTPLFPSMDADSPVLQQGMIMNRSLAAIKTSRANTGTSSAVKANRGNPSPSRRSSTPQRGPSSDTYVQAKTASNNRPATPTRSSTPTSIRASPNPRPSTTTRQTSASAPARPVTPMGARPATPTRRSATPTSSGRPGSSTPTLRRSSSSPTGSQTAHGGMSTRGNPSPTRSTGTSTLRGASPGRSTSSRGVSPVRGVSPAPSARGVSPAPSARGVSPAPSARGVSPAPSARGVSPAPSARGRSPSPSLRAPYPVEASDDIPPNLRTTSDRPSSAQRRIVGYGSNPGEVPVRSGSPTPPQRRTASPARSAASPARSTARSSSSVGQNVDKLSRAASSDVDSEGSFDTCSQSEKSGSGRRMSSGRGSDDYGRSSSLQKAKRGSTTSPQFAGPLTSKKFFESAAREYHRGQVAAFRPLMTNSSISTFYSSRASGLLRRPLTPSSTASSSEHGATVAHDSEVDDEEAGSNWKPLNGQAHEAHSPLHLFEKSLSSSLSPGPLDSTSIVDNEEMSNFFKDSELALEVEPQLEQPVTTAEINWLTRNEPEDTEYLWSRDGTDAESHPAFDGNKVEKLEPVSRAANMIYGKEEDIWYIYRHSSEVEIPAAGVSEEKTELTHLSVTTCDVSAAQIEKSQAKAGIGIAADASMDSKADDRERCAISSERDEDAFIDIQVDPCGKVTVKSGDPEVIHKDFTDTGNLVNESLPAASSVSSVREKLMQLSHQEHQQQHSINFETQILENKQGPPEPDVWNSLKLQHSVHQPVFEMREADKKHEERSELASHAKPSPKFASGRLPGFLSKSSSSKSSFRTPTSGGSLDLSRSTDTTSSCPSNASWEDPHYIGSKVWDSRSASDVARVSDVSESAPLTTAYEPLKDLCEKGVVKAVSLASQTGDIQRASNPGVITHNLDPTSASPLDEASEEHFDYVFECLGSKQDPSAKLVELPVVPGTVTATALEDFSVDPAKETDRGFSGHSASIDFRVEKNEVAKEGGIHADMSILSKSETIPSGAKNAGTVPDASSSPNAKVLPTRPSAKEEIVESTASPSPGSSTPKHMSSFKFSHKNSDKSSELKRSNTSRQATEGCKSQQSDSAAIPSRKSNSKATEKSAAATPPHGTKEKPLRAASPARPLPANYGKVPRQVPGANGEAPEELSIHSRFSNITVRSGSDTENFDWGPSSLEEAGSRCGSSSGTDTASMAILTTRTPPPAALRGEHDAAEPSSGREDEESEHPQPTKFSPSRRNAEIQSEANPNFVPPDSSGSERHLLKHSAPDCRNPMEAHTLEPGGWPKSDDPKHAPDAAVHPLRPMRASLHHAPKQNLDKLSEKLEQLETFGARVVLRDPQQQLLHSPPADRRPSADPNNRDPDRSTHFRTWRWWRRWWCWRCRRRPQVNSFAVAPHNGKTRR